MIMLDLSEYPAAKVSNTQGLVFFQRRLTLACF